MPFLLGGASSQTAPNQYCVGLSSYQQNIGSSVINANLARTTSDQISAAGNISVGNNSTTSASLLHMVGRLGQNASFFCDCSFPCMPN